MIIAYLLTICLALIVIQTALLGQLSAFIYDLMAPFIVYLAIYPRPKEALPVILAGGLAMDGLSGGVFGIHISVYLWMYVAIRQIVQYLHVDNIVLLTILVISGVAFESLAIAFSAIILAPVGWPVDFLFPVATEQILWGAVTGPLLLLLLIRGNHPAYSMEKRFFAEKRVLEKR